MKTYIYKILSAIIVFHLFTLKASCSNSILRQRKDTLSIGLDHFMSEEKFDSIASYLEGKLGIPVKFKKINSLVNIAGTYEQFDLIFINAFGFAYIKVSELPFDAFLAPVDSVGKFLTYRSCLISNTNSEVKCMSDLKNSSQDLNLSFSYASSTSGHIVPRLYLTNQLSGDLEGSFKNVSIQSSHEEVIDKVLSGNVDIGACSTSILQNKVPLDIKSKIEFNILWQSDPIPHAIWAINSSNIELRNDLKNAFNDIAHDLKLWNLLGVPQLKQYKEPDNSLFNPLIEQLKEQNELEFYLYYYESL